MSWIHNHSDLPDFLFPFLLFPYYPERQIGKLFYGRLNLSSSESPENEGGRGWCCMCSYILAHFRNRTVFNAKLLHGIENLYSRHFKISLGALISKYQRVLLALTTLYSLLALLRYVLIVFIFWIKLSYVNVLISSIITNGIKMMWWWANHSTSFIIILLYFVQK